MDTIKGTVIPVDTTLEGNLRGVFIEETSPDEEPRGALIEVSPVNEGQPIMGDFVSLTARGDGSLLYDAEITRIRGSGPPMVNSEAYRSGWDRIFGQGELEN